MNAFNKTIFSCCQRLGMIGSFEAFKQKSIMFESPILENILFLEIKNCQLCSFQ